MSKFYNYLNEENLFDIINLIEKNCKPFINDWKKLKISDFLYSSRKDAFDFKEKRIRKNRQPTSTPIEIHKLMDEWFNKNFGVKVRSQSLFCIFSASIVEYYYGRPYMVFPIGKYKSIWSTKIDDLYNEVSFFYTMVFEPSYNINNYKELPEDEKKMFKERLWKWLNDQNYKNSLVRTDNEVMIVTDKCYLVSMKYYQDLVKHFKG